MPYAANGHVSMDPIEGGVQISKEQYAAAIAGMIEGKIVTIDGGFAVVDPPPPETEPEQPEDPEPDPDALPDLLPYQFKAMLALSGKQADLESFIEAMSEPLRTIAKAKLEYSLVFKRDNELVQAARAGLGIPEQEFEALWLQAASIL